jgi:hypothetical protein
VNNELVNRGGSINRAKHPLSIVDDDQYIICLCLMKILWLSIYVTIDLISLE